MLSMTKNIQKIIKRCKESFLHICKVISDCNLLCISQNTFHSQNLEEEITFKRNLLRLLKYNILQKYASVEQEAIKSISNKTVTTFKLECARFNVKKIKSLLQTPQRNLNNFYCTKGIHIKSNLQDKSSKQTLQKNEKTKGRDDLEELWGGRDAFKLITFLKNDFDEVINNNKEVLVFFSAEWCPHCLKLRKPFGRAALMAKEANSPILFATFDVNINPDIADAKGVVGIPIIKYYKNGKFISNYRGKRTTDDLFEFVKNPPQSKSESQKVDL